MAFALMAMFIIEEPERGAKEEAVENVAEDGGHATYDGTISCAKVGAIVKVGTNLCMYLAELPNAMGWGVLFAYLTDFIAVDKNFGTVGATTAVSIFGLGLGLGAFTGGVAGQRLSNRCKQFSGAVPMTVAISVLFGALPFYWAIDGDYHCLVNYTACNATMNASGMDAEAFEDACIAEGFNHCELDTWATMVLVMVTAGFLLGIPNANVRAMLLNVNLPEVRGTTMTLLVVVSNLGKGVGPLLAATMIGSLGRFTAFNAAVGFFIISCVPYFVAILQLGRDVRRQAMAVEQIVKVEKEGKKKKRHRRKKITITANEIVVENVDDDDDDDNNDGDDNNDNDGELRGIQSPIAEGVPGSVVDGNGVGARDRERDRERDHGTGTHTRGSGSASADRARRKKRVKKKKKKTTAAAAAGTGDSGSKSGSRPGSRTVTVPVGKGKAARRRKAAHKLAVAQQDAKDGSAEFDSKEEVDVETTTTNNNEDNNGNGHGNGLDNTGTGTGSSSGVAPAAVMGGDNRDDGDGDAGAELDQTQTNAEADAEADADAHANVGASGGHDIEAGEVDREDEAVTVAPATPELE